MNKARPRQSGPTRRSVMLFVGLALIVAALVINGPGLVSLWYNARDSRLVDALPSATPAARGERVLILAPHPDDEDLCCAGYIRQALDRGASVSIAYMTSGDGFEWDVILLDRRLRPAARDLIRLGEKRMVEARKAASVLGVPASHLYFLGYPDGGLMHLFLENYATPYRSLHTHLRSVPYRDALAPGSSYTGSNLERDLDAVLNAVHPTIVLAPSPLDAHEDHRATGGIALRLLGKRGEVGRLIFWIVHGGLEWPLPKGLHPGLPLSVPPRGRGLPWRRLDLNPDQVAIKERALQAHATQEAVLSRFMNAFARRNELFSPQPLPTENLPSPGSP